MDGSAESCRGIKCPISSFKTVIAPTRELAHMEKHSECIFLGEVSEAWLTSQRKLICAWRKLVSCVHRESHSRRCSATNSHEIGQATSTSTTEMPALDEVLTLMLATLKHIPKRARQKFGKVLHDVLAHVISVNDEDAWTNFMMLPKCVLPSSKRAKKEQKLPSINFVTDGKRRAPCIICSRQRYSGEGQTPETKTNQ